MIKNIAIRLCILRASDSGSVLVEATLMLSVLAFLITGVVDYGIEIQQSIAITEAAAAGAAYGAIPGNQANITGMEAAATASATGVSGFSATATDIYTCTPGGATVSKTATCAGYGTPIEYVQVKTSASVPALIQHLGLASSTTINAVSTYRVPWTN